MYCYLTINKAECQMIFEKINIFKEKSLTKTSKGNIIIGMKSKDIVRAENSLREYILEEYSDDAFERSRINLYKYKGLTITISWKPNVEPNFNVQIMAFEASFRIETGQKIEGGLQDNDVSMITKWAKQSQNRTLMMRIWVTEAREKKEIRLKPFDM